MTSDEQSLLNIFGAPQRPLENFTHTAPADDDFTCDPELLADQADWFEMLSMGDEDVPATLEHFYLLYRGVQIEASGGYACNADARRWGVHAAIYKCDENGRVESWQTRVELQGVTIKSVRAKFEFLWSNEMLRPEPIFVPFEFEDGQR